MTGIEVLTEESLFVNFELLLALFRCDTFCLLKVHRYSAGSLCTHLPICSAENVLLHLVSVDTLSDRSVTLAIIAIKARLNLAFFLLASCAAKCVTKDVLTLDGGYVALVAWHTVRMSSIFLLLAAGGFGKSRGLALLTNLCRLIASVSRHALALGRAVLHHLYQQEL